METVKQKCLTGKTEYKTSKTKEKPGKQTRDQNAQKTSVQTARRQESDTWKTEYTSRNLTKEDKPRNLGKQRTSSEVLASS